MYEIRVKERKGYSGVATLSNKDFTIIGKGKNNENDDM